MKKAEQERINNRALEIFERAASALHVANNNFDVKRLRKCQAVVLVLNDYYMLQSYNTVVAVIDRNTGDQVDVLRKVYGYTATSAKHIAKFFSDYGYSGKYGKSRTYTFR